MKKILIALALLASIQVANAQVKSAADAKKQVDAAEEAAANPKKAEKADTWKKLGLAYVNAYDAPAGNIWEGASKQELAILMGNDKPTSAETVSIMGEDYTKEVYADKNLYFNAAGQLAIIEVTRPLYPDALGSALNAYSKAYSLDPSKMSKDVTAALQGIAEKYTREGYSKYQLGDFAASSMLFEKAAGASGTAPLSQVDTNALYNAGFTALQAGDEERGRIFFEKCYEAGYYAQDGEIFAKLAEVDTTRTIAYLEEGFSKFPQSQSILIGLINYYIKNNEDPNKLFGLLDQAKANEPNNPSLYYVEGNIRNELGQTEAAVKAYRMCAEINPEYEYGYIGEGIMFYNKALDIQEQAQEEMDDNKYMALAEDFEKNLKACIPPFEKAYEISKETGVRVSVAEYLKSACYRFRDQSAEYQEAFEKYSNVVATGQPD